MASKEQNVVSQNQKGGAVRVPKQAVGKYGDRKTRPALDNISNVASALPTLDGKPINRPITRGFAGKLLANAQATAVPGSKKSGPEVAKEVRKQVTLATTRKTAYVTKPSLKQKESTDQGLPKQVNQRPVSRKVANVAKAPPLSFQKKEEGKKVPVGLVPKVTSKPEYSRRREVHTLTSVLSARSKVACRTKERVQKEAQIEDIDAADAANHLAVVEYVEEIYIYYKQVEDKYRPHDYVIHQTDVNPKRRAILLDWIIEVHDRFKLRPETLYLTVYIIDRYLYLEEVLVPKTELQLVGICAMLIASKYEEIWAPQVRDLIEISSYAYERDAILEKEKQVLNKLDWYLTVPTLYMFLVRFIKAARADKQMENMVYFLAELGLLEHSVIKYSPSMVAASCVYVARCTLKKSPIWTPTLVHHTHYVAPQLCECAQILVNARLAAPQGKLIAVHKKYSREEFGKVALHQLEVSPSSTSTAYASCSSSSDCDNSKQSC